MPTPARIDNHTRRLVAPGDWDQGANGHCGALFVRDEVIDGVNYMRSAWEFQPIDAQRLLTGSKVIVSIAGSCHPVTNLMVDEMPEDFDPSLTARRFTMTDGRAAVRVEVMYPGKPPHRAYCEELIDAAEGLGIAVGRATDRIEALARQNGWVTA